MAVEIHKSFPVVEIFATTSAGSSTLLWGNIAGTLANQVDLQAALDAKAPSTPQFLTLATHSGIANERVFTPSADFAATDGGAGSTYSLALATQGGLTPGTYNTFTVNNKGIITAASSVPSLSPITTRGDLIIGDSSGLAVRLPIGTATYVLTSDGTDVSWAAPSSSFTLVNGNGTTVNGTGDGVDLGGSFSQNTTILGSESNYNFTLGNNDLERIGTFTGHVNALELSSYRTGLKLDPYFIELMARSGGGNGGGSYLTEETYGYAVGTGDEEIFPYPEGYLHISGYRGARSAYIFNDGLGYPIIRHEASSTSGVNTAILEVTPFTIKMLATEAGTPDAPTVGDVWTAVNADGSGAWSAPSSSFTLVNGNGTTVNGTGDGVDLGGTLTNDVTIDGNYGFNLGNTTPLVSTTISVDDRIEFNVNNANGSGYLGFIAGNPGEAGFHMEIGDSDYQHIFDVSNTGALLEQTDQISADVSTLYLHNTYSLLSFNSKRLKFETSGTTLNLGSDATGDTYYRNSSGYFTRLAAGTNGYVLTLAGGVPTWAATTLASGTKAQFNTALSDGDFIFHGSNSVTTAFSITANGAAPITFSTNGPGNSGDISLIVGGTDEIILSGPVNASTLFISSSGAGGGSAALNLQLGTVPSPIDGDFWITTGAAFARVNGVTASFVGTNTGDQTITNSSDATSHTVTLSGSGGTIQLIEGANITLTTGGTGSAGTVTIAASGGGGGITNGAANTELMMSNGTNAIASGIFVPSAGDLNLGTGVGGATRTVTAAGSATDIAMSFVSKGTGVVKINNVDFRLATASALFPSGYTLIGQDAFQLRSTGTGTLIIGAASATAAGQPPDVVIEGTGAGVGGSSTVGGTLKMFGGQSGITGIKSGDVIISGGQASAGNADGGDTYITYGVKAGSGKDGNVAFFTNSISNWQNMERGVFIADALTTPTGNPTNGNFHYIDATDSTPKWLDENGVTRKAWSAAEIIALLESEGYITNGQAESLSNQMN